MTAAERIRTMVRFAWPERRAILLIVLLTLAVAALNAIEPLILKFIFDELAGLQRYRILLGGLGLLALFALFRELFNGFSNWLTWRTRIGLQHSLLELAIAKLHRMPIRIQRKEGVGAILTRLDRSIQGLIGAAAQILFSVLPAAIFLAIAAWVMVALDWRLALVVIAFAPIPALVAVRAAPEQVRRERTLMDRWARIYSRFTEVLSGILIVRSFGMEESEQRRFLNDVARANRTVIRGVVLDTGYGAISNLAVALARLVALGLGIYLAVRHQATVGTIVAFLGYIGGLFGPVVGLSATYQTLQRASVSLDEIFNILELEEEGGDPHGATDLGPVKGEVRFEKVCFRYEDVERPILDGIDLRARPGELIAIVGPSGSGKTTMMALLMRFYEAQAGRILIDGRDIRTVTQVSLRRNIGVVLQDPLLFNDTVRANIAYGRPEASHAEIEAAAVAANASAFIHRLPEGYETVVGERGALLSVGERQRITIARALLKDAPILILDEAISSLDAESEEMVQGAIERLTNERTTFVIAHRLATVTSADRIVVLRNGRIAEMGGHTELLVQGGYYASLVKRQNLGLIPNETIAPLSAGAGEEQVS